MRTSTELKPWANGQELTARALFFAKEVGFSAGDCVLSPETKIDAFYYVREGAIEVSYAGAGGTKITVALIGPGEFFGEVGFFDQGSRVRTITASGDVDIALFDQEVMDTIRKNQPDLYIDFLLYLTRKICRKFRRIAGEISPIAAYADSIASRRSCKYSGAKPLPPSLIRSELWHLVHERVEKVSMELFDISLALQEDSQQGRDDTSARERCFAVLTSLVDDMPLFEKKIAGSGYEDILWGYIFKEVYPYFMRSRYAARSYHKPKGYAGDFLMIEHVYKNVAEGDGRLGELVDEFCLGRPASKAIRGRRRLLAEQLRLLSEPLVERGGQIAIMNLACGPNRELFDFLQGCEYSERIDALCVDIDSEALQYTNKYVNTFSHLASVRLMKENVIKWSLGRVRQQIAPQDIIYSAGLCDYLDDRLFKALITRCYHHLKPGGTLILGNFNSHKDAVFMDRILRWELIYRNSEQLLELFADTPFSTATVLSEEEHVNLFALAVRD
ncbi:MAG TPA: cyclic nucleotide-binding domain-containing protein [Desulfobulbaceae bacterium]|nr:cyclic nucleotide-binding domain-containing protein [Desulfobulbaceae bacterium]